jgi:threonine dehydratase
MVLALKSQGVKVVGAQVEGVDAMARALRGDADSREPAATLADGVRVRDPGLLTRAILQPLLDDVVIVREAELRETLVRLALEEHVIAEGAGALALAAGRRVPGKRKCAVVSGGNLDAGVLATLLQDIRPRPPRKPRRRVQEPVPGLASEGPVLDIAEERAGTTRLRPAAAARITIAPPAYVPSLQDCPT